MKKFLFLVALLLSVGLAPANMDTSFVFSSQHGTSVADNPEAPW